MPKKNEKTSLKVENNGAGENLRISSGVKTSNNCAQFSQIVFHAREAILYLNLPRGVN